MDRLQRKHRLGSKSLHAEGRAKLLAYPWPGNVRELSHELKRALVFEDADELRFGHLHPASAPGQPRSAAGSMEWFNEQFSFPNEGGFSLEDAINRLINHALAQTNNNVSAGARLLGVSRDYVRYRLGGQKTGETPGDIPQGPGSGSVPLG